MTNTFRVTEGVLVREVGGELLLLNSDSELYFALNPSGAAMYELVAAGRPLDDVATVVADRFGAPPDVVRSDLDELIATLVDKGLIRPDD